MREDYHNKCVVIRTDTFASHFVATVDGKLGHQISKCADFSPCPEHTQTYEKCLEVYFFVGKALGCISS